LGALVDATMVGDTDARRLELREWRHAIPATLNERGIRAKSAGGGKLSTDWAVDWRRIGVVLPQARALCRREGVEDIYCFGHIGNGHPHVNLLAADASGREHAHRAAHAMCRLVQVEGGTISAEHGVGKVKKEYLPYSLPPQAIEWMKAFKRQLDPSLILAPGNIFDFQ
jgi:FAD/FMN-containing dehydrogenase